MTESIARIVKRYANRKLYDTTNSQYVTLDQIAEMIRKGEDVKVVDNSSKEDLTSVTLAQIVFEEEKRQRSFLPLSALRKVIQSGGESLHDFVNQLSESAERVGRVFRRDETNGTSTDKKSSDVVEETTIRTDPVRLIREFVEGVQDTVDNWQKRLDTSIQNALEGISPWAPLQKELKTLRERIVELEKNLERLVDREKSQ
ncbi:MAG: polyhydroxyalkanoate synthesis regulator DNA-binding domain-containing protein [Pseudomonadota bacterium]